MSYKDCLSINNESQYKEINSNQLINSENLELKHNNEFENLKRNKITNDYLILPADCTDITEYDYNNPSTQMLLSVNKNDLNDNITTSINGIEYDYDNRSLKVNGNIDIKSINGFKYYNNNIYNDTHYNPFPNIVKAFYEMTNEHDFLYDYSGNRFDLINKGAIFTINGAYFDVNDDIRYRSQFQEDIRRIELRGVKLTEMLNTIKSELSISFDFNPLENESVIMMLTNSNSLHTFFSVKITSTGILKVVFCVESIIILSVESKTAVTLNKHHHFCFNSGINSIYVYLDDYLIGKSTIVIDINSYNFESLVIGCEKDCKDEKYAYPYAGWISNLLITSHYLGDSLRTAIFNKHYGYDIIILAGQSNMVGMGKVQEGIDNDYSEIDGIVFQYDFNSNSIIPAKNQLKHYLSGGTYTNNMGGWLEFSKNYIKYYKKSSTRKLLLIPCALGGSSFKNHWRTGLPMISNLITNTNICTSLNKLNKIIGMIWYQGESEVFLSNESIENDLYNFRENILKYINGFTESTPIIVTKINNKYDINNNINGISANQFINNSLSKFANSFNYGVVKTEDLKLNDDWIHLNTESLRIVGKRWFDKLCEISRIDNRSKPIINTIDKTEMNELSVTKLKVKDLKLINDEKYDIDLESFHPIGKNIDVTTNIQTSNCKAFYQPKTDDIWLIPIGTLLSFKYFNVKTRKLIERTDWVTMKFNGMASCMYKDKLYVYDCNHSDTYIQGEIIPDSILYIIDTLNYSIDIVKDFVFKTSNIGTTWTVPEESSSNVNKEVIKTITYSSIFPYYDKLYFIPFAQQDVGIFDLKTRTFDQKSYVLGYVGGFFGSVFNPSNKFLYFSRAYKVGSLAGWDIPYLDFNQTLPILKSIILPNNNVGFKSGTYCHTNGSTYIPMCFADNSDKAYILKINSSNIASSLTLEGTTANKQFNSILYSPDDRILLHSCGVIYRINPSYDTLDSNILISPGRIPQCFDKNCILYSFSDYISSSYGMYKMTITINNKEIFNPIFNCIR